MGMNCSDKCRLCEHARESIQHICSGCPALAQKDYPERHNSHSGQSNPSGTCKAICTELPYYKCKPEQVLSKDKTKRFWYTSIITGRSVRANRPYLVLFDKAETAIIFDIAIPLDDKLKTTIAEKKRK
jgi:hypothetical protein